MPNTLLLENESINSICSNLCAGSCKITLEFFLSISLPYERRLGNHMRERKIKYYMYSTLLHVVLISFYMVRISREFIGRLLLALQFSTYLLL